MKRDRQEHRPNIFLHWSSLTYDRLMPTPFHPEAEYMIVGEDQICAVPLASDLILSASFEVAAIMALVELFA